MKKQTGSLLCVAVIFACSAHSLAASQAESTERLLGWLVVSHADYLDRVHAIWAAQMIAQMTGVRFEHQPRFDNARNPVDTASGIRSCR